MSVGNVKTGKRITIAFIAFLLAIVILKTFLFRFGNLDEIWHYNLCRGITLGNLPYRDISLVCVPLYYFVFALPMFIVRKFIVYRAMEVCLIFSCALILFFIVKAESGFGYAAVTAMVSCLFTDITSYNNLLFLFVLLMYLINKREPTVRRNVWLGILAALAIWSRQTSGFIVFLAECIYLGIDFRRRKVGIKGFIPYFGGFIGVNIVFLIYLISTSTFFAFWDYCFFGLAGYSNVLDGFDIWGIPMVIIAVLVLAAEFILLLKRDFLRTLNHILLTLAVLTIAIPTTDMTHAVFALFMALIPLMAIIKSNIRDSLKPILGWGAFAVLVITIARGLIPLFSGITFDEQCKELDLIPMSGVESSFVLVRDKNRAYKEQGYDVVVFSSCSAIISIYDGSFNPPFDLFLVGSFGTTDPVDIVRDVCSKDNMVIVIPDDYVEENWMNPGGVYEYIVENCTPVDRVGRFVYYIPG